MISYRRLCKRIAAVSHHALVNHLRPKVPSVMTPIVSQGTMATNGAEEQARFLSIPFGAHCECYSRLPWFT